ncbi:hypothetical protein SAMN05216299_11341 [Nitrosospira sp. Nsp14]|nr:hypothetical protein SAMN05216299_11341 [Nitrosospira sp. Nsp14]
MVPGSCLILADAMVEELVVGAEVAGSRTRGIVIDDRQAMAYAGVISELPLQLDLPAATEPTQNAYMNASMVDSAMSAWPHVPMAISRQPNLRPNINLQPKILLHWCS